MFVRIPQLQPFNNIIQSNTVAFFFCIVLNLIHHFKIQFCLISIQLISTGFEASFNTPCLKAFSTKVIRIKGNIAGWENSGITHRDGSVAGNYWRIVRGVPGMVLRLEYEVPASFRLCSRRFENWRPQDRVWRPIGRTHYRKSYKYYRHKQKGLSINLQKKDSVTSGKQYERS